MNFLSRWFRRLPKAPSWIAPEALARRLGRESALLIIDVRSPDEFTGPLGHIREATNMPLNELPAHLPDLVRENRSVVVVCKTDRRSSMAAQQLQEAGMSDVSVLRGGMEQWRVLGLPARWEALEGSQFVPKHHWSNAAIGWVDAVAHPLDREDAPLRAARARVLAEDIRALRAIPTSDRAALDGFAVQASASLGASAYNPIRLPLIAVAAGDVLPAGTDSVVPLELAEPDERAYIEIVEAVAAGQNVEQQGAIGTIGATLVPAGTQLAARHIGLLAIAGLFRVPVVRRPRVRILHAKPVKAGAREDSNGPMIRAAVERDGGVVEECVEVERDLMAIRAALVEAGVNIVLVIGGTGPGIDDHSAAALAEAGELAIHGVALRPGETTGLGRTVSGVPVVLLPGAPAACLWSYELFGGRAIRRFGGRGPDLPYRSREMITARKIVSAIGMTEICPVRCGAGDSVEPLPSFAETGLMAAVGADGFVIVPEGSEGHPQGARVTVYLYEGC